MESLTQENVELCKVKDLKPGQVISEDVFVDKCLLMKKGTVVTQKNISNLRKRNINFVYVKKDKESMTSISPKQIENYNISKEKLKEEFYEILGSVSLESRYGNVLKNKEEILYVKTLFIQLMSKPTFYHYWLQIKKYDEYTYLRSMDVFILGTLFCLKENIPNVEDVALGFLFHDIGNLKVPKDILKKKERLTKKEYLIVQNHTVYALDILEKIGLEKIAYLAKYHHERMDGSGYPEGLKGDKQSIELQILQIVDSYSAITLRKPFKEVIPSHIALRILYENIHMYNEEILNRFVEFLGIYPENAHILLSNGSEAIVENVNPNIPLLPIVKVLPNNDLMRLPTNLTVTIQKMVSYNTNDSKQMFSMFTKYLLDGLNSEMESYHNLLKNSLHKFEWFTHIYIPLSQLLEIYKGQSTFVKSKLLKAKENLSKLIDKTLLECHLSCQSKENLLIMLDSKLESSLLPKLLQGLLLAEDISSNVMVVQKDDDGGVDKEFVSSYFNRVMIVGSKEPKKIYLDQVKQYHLLERQLDSFIKKFMNIKIHNINLMNEIEKYKVNSTILA